VFWLTLVALTEFVGGILLVLGLFTRFAALAVVIFMINAVVFTSAKGFFWSAGGMEYSILIGFVALVLLIKGGGECSIDSKMSKEL
jgi:putative oxidoreductase